MVRSLGQEDPLEEEMATHSSILASRITWTKKPGRLHAMESQNRTRLSDLAQYFLQERSAFYTQTITAMHSLFFYEALCLKNFICFLCQVLVGTCRIPLSCGMWDLNSPTRNQTQISCIGSIECQPLDHRGSPQPYSLASEVSRCHFQCLDNFIIIKG